MKKINKIIICIVICIVTIFLVVVAGIKLMYPVEYLDVIKKYSKEYDVDSNLVLGVVNAESGFSPNAVSSKGAVGLMQLMPSTARFVAESLNEAFDERALYSAETNIRYGVFYLHYLFNKYIDEDKVLFCYNAGEGTYLNFVEKFGGFDKSKIEIKETKNYIKKVEKCKRFYSKVVCYY